MRSFFFSLLAISIFTFALSQVPTEVVLGEPLIVEEKANVVTHFISYTKQETDLDYIRIKTTPKSQINPGKIFISQDTEPTEKEFEYKSERINVNVIYLPVASLKNDKINIAIYCEENCAYTILAETTDFRELTPGEDYTVTGVDDDPETEDLFAFIQGITYHNNIMIYYYTDSVKDLDKMKMTYVPEGSEEEYEAERTVNGYAFNYNLTESTSDESIALVIKIKGLDKNTTITIGARYMDVRAIATMYETQYVYLNSSIFHEMCYHFTELIPDKKMILNFGYVSHPFDIIYKKGTKETSEHIIYGKYLLLDSNDYIGTEGINFCYRMETIIGETEEKTLTVISQFLYLEMTDMYQKYISPIINDYMFKRYLPHNTIINYHRAVKSIDNYAYNFHLTALRGNPVLYGYSCEKYPCVLSNEDFEIERKKGNLTIASSLNNDYTIYTQNENEIFIVKCESSDSSYCEYTMDSVLVSISNEVTDHYLTLIPGYEYNIDGNLHYFKVIVDHPKLHDDLEISVSSMTTSCSLFFSSEYEVVQKDARGKVIYEFKDLQKEYTFYLENDELQDKVCTINYYYDQSNSFYLRSGIQNIHHISTDDKSKHYMMVRREFTDYPFVLMVQSLNCRININFNNQLIQDTKYQQFNIGKDEALSKNSTFYFDISVGEFDVKTNNDFYCTVLISGTDTRPENAVVLTEGTHTQMVLNKDVHQMSFTLPFIKLIPHFYVEFDPSYKKGIDVMSQIGDGIQTDTLYKSTYINLADQYKEKCTDQNCNVLIIVELKDEEEPNDIPITIWYKYLSGWQPVYIEKNKLYTSVGYTSSRSFFYTDIAFNEEGEVVIDFKKGGGLFYAKLVGKNVIEDPCDWNDRVLLPMTPGDNKFTEFDNLKNRIKYTTADTAKCGDGCELFITIQDIEDIRDNYDDNPLTMYFSIYVQKKEDVVSIAPEKYTLGYFDAVSKFKYYRMKIEVPAQNLLVSMKTYYGELYISEGNVLPSIGNYKWKLPYGTKEKMISASDIKKDSFKDVILTIGVITQLNFANEFSFYQFRVNPVYGDDKIIKLTSESEETCTTKEYNEYCYFILPLNKNEKLNELFIYAYVEENPSFPLQVFANKFKQFSIDLIENYTSIHSMLPTKEVHEYCGKDKNYLYFDDIPDISNDNYLLVSVYVKYPQTIKVSTSINPDLSKVYLNPNNNKMVFLKYEDSGNNVMRVPYKFETSQYNTTFQIIGGKSKFFASYTDGEEKSQEIEVNGAYEMNVNDKTKINEFLIRSEDPSNDFFIAKLMPNNGLLNKLKEGDNIVDDHGSPFPNFVYLPFPKNKMGMLVKTKVLEATPVIPVRRDTLKEEAYIVKGDFIKKYMTDPLIEIEGEKMEVSYDTQFDGFIVHYFNTDTKLHENDFIFIKVKLTEQNKPEYTHAVTLYTVQFEYNYPEMEMNKYQYKELTDAKKDETFRLNKEIEEHNIFVVEIAEEPKGNNYPLYKVDYSLEEYKDLPTYKTDVTIRKDTIENGKHLIIAEYTGTSPLLLTLLARAHSETTTLTQPLKYIVKYKTFKSFDDVPKYSYIHKITSDISELEVSITFNEIITKSESVLSGDYIVEVFNFRDIPKSESIETIYTKSSLSILSKSFAPTFDTKPVTYTLTLPSNSTDVYINIIGAFILDSNEEIYLSYTPIVVKQKSQKLPPKKYHLVTFDSPETKSFQLSNPDKKGYYKIEFGEDFSLLKNNSKFGLQIAYEPYTPDEPTYENSTEIRYINETTENGKTSFMLKYSSPIYLHFILKELPQNNINTVAQLLFKYTLYTTNDPEPQFTFNNKVSGSILFGKLTVKFKEINDLNSYINTTNYTISLYNKSTHENIQSIIDTSDVIYRNTILDGRTGYTIKHEVDLENITDDFVIGVMAMATTIEEEEIILDYELVEASSSNWIVVVLIVIALLILLGVGGYFGYKFWMEKKGATDALKNESEHIDPILNDAESESVGP